MRVCAGKTFIYVDSMAALLAFMWSWPSHLILCFSLAFALVVITKANWFLQPCLFIAKSEDCSRITVFLFAFGGDGDKAEFSTRKKIQHTDSEQMTITNLPVKLWLSLWQQQSLKTAMGAVCPGVKSPAGAVSHSSDLSTERDSRELRLAKAFMWPFTAGVKMKFSKFT